MLRLSIFLILLITSLQVGAKNSISFCYEEWSPYAFRENSKHSGKVIEQLVSELNKHSISSEFYEYPFSRCLLQVNKGAVDFALFVDHYENIKVIEHKIVDWQLAVVSTNQTLTKQDFIEQSGIRVIISNDYEYPEAITNVLESQDKQVFPTSYFLTNEHETKALFNLIIKDQADAMIVDKVWSRRLIEKHNFPVYVSDWNLVTIPQYIGFSKFTPQNKIDIIESILSARNKKRD